MASIRSILHAARLAPCAVASCLVMPPAAIAQQPQRLYVQVGVLRCDVSAGIGQIIGSTRQLACVYRREGGRTERYLGTIRHTGLDLGSTTRGVMAWGVLARSEVRRGALNGRYTGISAEATVGLGVGTNILFGGSENSVALQPVSVQAQEGLNIAIGVAELTLERLRRNEPRPPRA